MSQLNYHHILGAKAIGVSRKWNSKLYDEMKRFVSSQTRRSENRLKKLPDAFTMPGLSTLRIGAAKRMTAAIMFFDFEKFTNITSHISPEQTLMILNISTTTVMRIIREWGGTVEKHTGDGVMAIIGTETRKTDIIAQEAIESAQTIKYMMQTDVMPQLVANGLPTLNFRIGLEMGEVLISRIGLHGMNFLTAVGSPANRASKIQALAKPNGIAIGEDLAKSLHPYLQDFIETGDDPEWKWHANGVPYNYYHYNFEWCEPKLLLKWLMEFRRIAIAHHQ